MVSGLLMYKHLFKILRCRSGIYVTKFITQQFRTRQTFVSAAFGHAFVWKFCSWIRDKLKKKLDGCHQKHLTEDKTLDEPETDGYEKSAWLCIHSGLEIHDDQQTELRKKPS